MSEPVSPEELAWEAGKAAGVTVDLLQSIEHLLEVEHLFAHVWGSPDGEAPMGAHLLKALSLSGNYVAGAYGANGELVGASAGWAGVGAHVELHSHITGVVAGQTGRGVGYALKLHQRAWALERRIEEITWTFDPLVRRNATFNLAKLGVSVTGYLENAYGAMADALNAGEASDRLFVRWFLRSPRVEQALAGGATTDSDGGLPLLIDVSPDGGPALRESRDGDPAIRQRLSALRRRSSGFVVRLPSDIEELRRHSPALAQAWRMATREVLAPAVEEGADLSMSAGRDLVVRWRAGGLGPP